MAPDDDLFRRFDEICHRRTHDREPGPLEDTPAPAKEDLGSAKCTQAGGQRPPLPRIPSFGKAASGSARVTDSVGGAADGGAFITDGGVPDDGSTVDDEACDEDDDAAVEEWLGMWRELGDESDVLGNGSFDEFLKPRCMSAPQISEMKSEVSNHDNESQIWNEAMWGSLARLRQRVAVLAQNAPVCRPRELKVLSSGLGREMESFKTQQRLQFQCLAGEEASLQASLAALERRCDAWLAEPCWQPRALGQDGGASHRASSGSRSRAPSTGRDASGASQLERLAREDPEIQKLRCEMEALEAEIEEAGGPTGGWTTISHEIFTRLFRTYKQRATPQFLAAVVQRLYDHDEAQVLAHVAWLPDHKRRQRAKRDLLSRWRERRKELERQHAAAAADRVDPEEAKLRRQALEREHAERRRKVAEWKRLRTEEVERAAAVQYCMALEQARMDREQQRRHVSAQKKAVEAYRRHREAERDAASNGAVARPSSAGASRRAVSQEDRERIAHRNLDALRKKMQLQQQQQQSGAEQRPESRRRSSAYAHVESRLHAVTESYIQKIASKEPSLAPEPPRSAAELPPRFAPAPRGRGSGADRRPASAGPAGRWPLPPQ